MNKILFLVAGAAVAVSLPFGVSAATPTVDLKVDGSDGPITKTSPASFTLSWTVTGTPDYCSAASSWSGNKSFPTGSSVVSSSDTGNLTYTLNCYGRDGLPRTPGKVGGVDNGGDYYTDRYLGLSVKDHYEYLFNTNYSGGPDAMHVYDIADPANPVRVASTTAGYYSVKSVVSGNYLYVLQQGATFEVYSLSNPALPSFVTKVTVGNNSARSLAVVGHYLYIGGGYVTSKDLTVYDIANPAAPTLVKTIDYNALYAGLPTTSIFSSDIAVVGSVVYVAIDFPTLTSATASRVFTFDVSNPANPVRVDEDILPVDTTKTLSERNSSLAVSGSTLYVAGDYGNIHIYNISNSANPTYLRMYTTTDLLHVSQPNLSGVSDLFISPSEPNLLYAGVTNSGLVVFDISDPTVPVFLKSTSPNRINAIGAYGHYILTAEGGAGVDGKEMSSFTNLVSDSVTVSVVPAPPPTVDLKINASDGPLTKNAPADLAFSWVTGNSPDSCEASTWSYYTGLDSYEWTGDKDAAGGSATLSGMPASKNIYTLDCYGSKSLPTVQTGIIASSTAGTTESVDDVVVLGHYALAVIDDGVYDNPDGTADLDELAVYDIADPLNPVKAGSAYTAGSLIAVSGNYAYVVGGHGVDPDTLLPDVKNLEVFDMSDPTHPLRVMRLSAPSGHMTVVGNFLYVSGSYPKIYDITNPVNPVLIGTYNATSIGGMAVDGRYAYVVDNSVSPGKLLTLDVLNPSKITKVSEVALTSAGSAGSSIAVRGNYIYVTNFYGTVDIYNRANPAAPYRAGAINLGISYPRSVIAPTSQPNYVYVGDENAGIAIVNVTNPAAPVVVATSPEFVKSMTMYGNYLITGDAYGYDYPGKFAVHAEKVTDSVTVTVNNPVGPDLIAQNLVVPTNMAAGSTVTLSAVIKNIGNASAPQSSARFCIDSGNVYNCTPAKIGEIGVASVRTLSAGASQTVSKPWTATLGTHTFYVYAESGYNITETNETNNASSITFTVNPFCSDGVDNDGDGKTDAEDPGCWTDHTDSSTYDGTGMQEESPAAVLSITASPRDVHKGAITSISWQTQNVRAGSCTMTGSNGDQWTADSGTQTTRPVLLATEYRLTCRDDENKPVAKALTLRLIPSFLEI